MNVNPELRAFYRGKYALVTGGLGNIGSNLALALVELGAKVTAMDNRVVGCGANDHNLQAAGGRVTLWESDIARADEYPCVIESADVVFNLAGEVSHIHSMLYPARDLAINTESQIRFLQIVARYAPGKRVVYAGTRQVYGVPQYLPVDELHPLAPPDFNGVHKLCATNYHLLLGRLGQIDPIVLRLTNVIGPRMAIQSPCQGFLSVFTRCALRGQPLVVYGDGTQLRDPVYVDDIVDVLLRAGAVREPRRRVLNVGSTEPLTIMEIAHQFSNEAGLAAPECRPFPSGRAAIDVGGYYTDTAACHQDLGWRATTSFSAAVRSTLDFYERHIDHYLAPGAGPCCALGHL